jgi:hypothetical protein
MPSIDILASSLIGTTVFINYPYFTEAFVTAVSDSHVTIRGHEPPHNHNAGESEMWRYHMSQLTRNLVIGEHLTGTAGWSLPKSSVSLSVRPFDTKIRHTSRRKQGKKRMQNLKLWFR